MSEKELNDLIHTGELAKQEIFEKSAEAAAAVDEGSAEEIKAENEKRKRTLIKFGLMTVLAAIILVFASIAWFTMNKDVGTSGMGVKTKGLSFDLITLSDDDTNKNGVYYDPYHVAIQSNESESYDIWLVDSDSNMNNYANTGTDDGTLGIEPGSSGVLKFYIKPYENVSITFTFQTIGYTARTTTVGEQQTVSMTELPSAAGNPACFLNGHVLLFEDNNSTTNFYSGLIPTGADGKRSFTREFELNGSYDTDTDGDGTDDAYEVDIYWIWPETLDTLVFNSGSSATLVCDKDAAVPQGETYNDYNKVVNNICSYPQYYLNNYSPTATYTESFLVGRNAMYNDADQEIGMNIDYVLLRLGTDTTGN